jgi:hypothetical protein
MQSCDLVPTLGVILNEMSTVLGSLVYTRQNWYTVFRIITYFYLIISIDILMYFFGMASSDDQKAGTF